MKYLNSKMFTLMLLATLVLVGTASAAVTVEEDVDFFADLSGIWTFGNPAVTTANSGKFITTISGTTWTDADGRLAVLNSGDTMVIETTEATDTFNIVFASDKNDGMALVCVDGEVVWKGDTWANVPTGQPIGVQKIRSLEITGLESGTHTITIKNLCGVQAQDKGHVTIYKYGYKPVQQPEEPENPHQEIPEFPTVALPVAAILGLAFFMQRRKEE